MAQSQDSIQTTEELSHQLSEILHLLQEVKATSEKLPDNINWLGLAEARAFDAQVDADLESVEIAVSIYEQLAKQTPEGGESFLLSAMMLRASMINKLGVHSGHSLLEVEPIILWFFKSLTLSYSEAKAKAKNWQSCDINEIRELRRIKNRLGVISVLAQAIDLDENIKNWLSLTNKLP